MQPQVHASLRREHKGRNHDAFVWNVKELEVDAAGVQLATDLPTEHLGCDEAQNVEVRLGSIADVPHMLQARTQDVVPVTKQDSVHEAVWNIKQHLLCVHGAGTHGSGGDLARPGSGRK